MSALGCGADEQGRNTSMRADEQSIGDREAAAAYVAELSRDLAVIARSHGLDALWRWRASRPKTPPAT
jgi:hypothetical protein